MLAERKLRAVCDEALEAAKQAFFDEFGEESAAPERVRFVYSADKIPKGKAAWWEPASAWESEEVRLDPAFSEPHVAIIHEVIHVVLGRPCPTGDCEHDSMFHRLADRLGLPERFRD